MFLERLVLKNVRSIENLELTFSTAAGKCRPWTILLGENGAGKSTVLRSIALALAGSDGLPELLPEQDRWIRRGEKEAEIHADLVTADGERRQIALRLRRGQPLGRTFSNNRESLERLDAALMHAPRNYFTIGYGVSRRLAAERGFGYAKSAVMRNPRAQNVATLFSPDATLQSVENWAMDIDYRKPRHSREMLRETFADMLPGIEFEKIDKTNRQLLFRTPDGVLPLEDLSEGYQNIISWCGDLLYRITETFADYKRPLEARGLLLIDEVDLHLHPLWQRKLIHFLQAKLPNFQIFATTHSPLTAHQASEGELFLLRRPDRDTPPQLEPFSGDPRKMLLHQFLLSPAFGLDTADSRHIELLKEEYSQLEHLPKKSAPQRKRLLAVTESLADAPEWQLNSKQARRRADLLAEIRRELAGKGKAAGSE